jgi:hypothetical protein
MTMDDFIRDFLDKEAERIDNLIMGEILSNNGGCRLDESINEPYYDLRNYDNNNG